MSLFCFYIDRKIGLFLNDAFCDRSSQYRLLHLGEAVLSVHPQYQFGKLVKAQHLMDVYVCVCEKERE